MEASDNNVPRYYIRESNGGKYCYLNAANNLIVVNDISEADTFSEEEVQKHLSGKKKRFYEAVIVEHKDAKECVQVEPESVKAASEAKILKNNLNGILAQLSYLAHNADAYENKLQDQLKGVQEEICDIQHYLELCVDTPEEAQRSAQLLQKSLQRRREIKDALHVLDVLRADLLCKDLDDRVTSCQVQIDAMDYRKYRPRQLPELFVNQPIAS